MGAWTMSGSPPSQVIGSGTAGAWSAAMTGAGTIGVETIGAGCTMTEGAMAGEVRVFRVLRLGPRRGPMPSFLLRTVTSG